MYHERGDTDKLWKNGCCHELEKMYQDLWNKYNFEKTDIEDKYKDQVKINR